jgi:DNA-binding winged helix-turn-helix (wHTH) protein
MADEFPNDWQIGPYRFRVREGILERGGEKQEVRGKLHKFLLFIVENQERRYTRKDIRKAVWGEHVEENSVEAAASKLRKLLRKDKDREDSYLTYGEYRLDGIVAEPIPFSDQLRREPPDAPEQTVKDKVQAASQTTFDLNSLITLSNPPPLIEPPLLPSQKPVQGDSDKESQNGQTTTVENKWWRRYFLFLIHYPLRYLRRLWEVTRHPFRFSDSVREHPRALLFELIWFFPVTLGIIGILQGSMLWSAIEILAISSLLAAAWRLVRGATSFRNDVTFLLYLAATLSLLAYLAWFVELQPLKIFIYNKISAVKTTLDSTTSNCLRLKDSEFCIEQAKTKAALDLQAIPEAKPMQWAGVLSAAMFTIIVLAGISIAVAALRRRNRTGAWRTVAALLLFIALQYGWLVVRTLVRPQNHDIDVFKLVVTPNCGAIIHVPDGPTLNPGPLMYSGIPGTTIGTCADQPLIDVRNLNGKDRDARWSANSNEHAKGIHAQRGDTIRVYVYVDNGARQDLPNPNIATDLMLHGYWRTSEDGISIFSVDVSSSNAPSISSRSLRYGGDAVVTIPAGAHLELIKNSTTLCLDKEDIEELFKWSVNGEGHCSMPNQVPITLPDTLFQTGIGIGDLKPGYDRAATIQTLFVVK